MRRRHQTTIQCEYYSIQSKGCLCSTQLTSTRPGPGEQQQARRAWSLPLWHMQVSRRKTNKQGQERRGRGVAPLTFCRRTSQGRGLPPSLERVSAEGKCSSFLLQTPKLSSLKQQWVIISHHCVDSLGPGRRFSLQTSPVVPGRCWTELETAEVSTRLYVEMASLLTSGTVGQLGLTEHLHLGGISPRG